MNRQHASPIIIDEFGSKALTALSLGTGPAQISELDLQTLLHDNPQCLPIAEIDPVFRDAVPICMELNTSAGPIDNLLITPSGLPVLVECKLWRNPEARREVVGQIIDYAKELTRWSASDLQREVARRVERSGNPLIALLTEAGHVVDEIAFNDALTHNLRRGRFLLLIVGDGIREGVEAIAEYLQAHAGLHFSLGLVELPIFLLDDGRRLILPRILARTQLIQRTVVAVPDGHQIRDLAGEAEVLEDEDDPVGRVRFWHDFVAGLALDDPDQPKPRPGKQGYVTASMPVPGGNVWLVIYRSEPSSEVGIYLSFARESIGAQIIERLLGDWPAIQEELGSAAIVKRDKLGRQLIQEAIQTGPWTDANEPSPGCANGQTALSTC